jgi:putative adenylate-forming enzyme
MRAWTFLRSYLSARWRFTHLRGDGLRRYQDRRTEAIVAYARRHSPFHRDRFAGVVDWRAAPTIDKAAMMANFDTYTTCGLRLDEAMAIAIRAETAGEPAPSWKGRTLGLSSGTSGHRGLFVIDETERMTWAGAILARTLPSPPPRGYRVALFLRAASRLYDSVHGRWVRLRFWDLMTPIDEVIPTLREFAPNVLIGPPSLLVRLALVRDQLRIKPRQVFSVAEVLDPEDETRLQAAFGVSIGQVYQCTEGLLAVSCPRGSLHLQEDLVAVDLEPAADSVEPRWSPIVTDLWRRTQPILRYRLNDLVTLRPEPCECGSAFRVLARIDGRCDDICTFARLDGGSRLIYPDVVRRMILLADPRIEDYRVVQHRPAEFRVHLRIAGGTSFDEIVASVRASAARIAATYACRTPELSFSAEIPPTPAGGKLRRVLRIDVH